MTQPTSKIRPQVQQSALAILTTMGLLAMPLSAQAADKVEISAKSNGERITVSVPTGLLETDEGTRKLYAALERRAEKSCKITIPMRIGSAVSVGLCTKRLMKGFVAELDNEALAAIHTDNT